MKVGIGVSGHVVVTKYKRDGTVTEERRFDNVALLAGLEYMHWRQLTGSPGSHPIYTYFTHLFLGTGATEPTTLDAGLENRSATLPAKATGTSHSPTAVDSWGLYSDTYDHDNKIYSRRMPFNFKYGEGEAEGVWTELGLAGSSTYDHPMTRALFRDDNGLPMSLTVLSDEFLEINYYVTYYDSPGEDQTGSFSINGQALDYTLSHNYKSLFDVNRYGWDRTTTGLMGRNYPFGEAAPNIAAESYTRTFDQANSKTTYDITLGPSSGDQSLSAIHFSGRGYLANGGGDSIAYSMIIDPPFTKKADYRVSLQLEVTFQILGPTVTGVTVSAVTSTSLDFTWDTYSGATDYVLILRQAGTIIEEKVVTIESASFTGLTASTEYHLDIQPRGTAYDGGRSIHPATTGGV